jgi:Undecaprenyl-phosphate galactose phosphotransferase WbaP
VKSDITDVDSIAPPAEVVVDPATQTDMSLKSRVQAWRQWLVVLTLVFSDILLASLFFALAIVLQGAWGQETLSEITNDYILLHIALWIGVRALLGLYPGYGLDPTEELRRQTYATVATLAVTAMFALGFEAGELLSRLLVGLNFLECLLLAPLGRHLVKWGLMRLGLWGKPVAVLGAGETGKQLVRTLQREWGLGFRPVAVFDFPLGSRGGLLEGVPPRGTVSDALDTARRQKIDTAIFAMPHIRRQHLAKYVDRARRSFLHVVIIPNLSGITTSAITARNFAGTFGVEIKHNLLNPWTLRAKRLLDLVFTIVGGSLILPFLLVLSLLVWLDSGSPIFYKSKRIVQGGKVLWSMKFRTMVPGAERMLQRILEENAELKQEYLRYHKLRDDPRITSIGRFLRKTSLDELPQLWNVLRGEMSLVGPRPYQPFEFEKIGPQSEILHVPPGITGPWQVAGRSNTSFEERVQLDTYYVRDWSVWLDVIILARTVKILIFGRGAY